MVLLRLMVVGVEFASGEGLGDIGRWRSVVVK